MKKYVHYNGKKIFYTDTGSGSPLILIHGYLETGDVWDGFVEKLSSSHRVIVVDLPGHGGSDIYSEVHTMEFLAGAIYGFLNTIGIDRIFMAGHSLGGYVTLAFLQLFPDKLTGYSLFHSHPFSDSKDIINKREHEIMLVNSGKKYLIYPENIKKMFADTSLDRFANEFERSKNIASSIREEGITAVLKGMMARPSRADLMEAGKVPCLWILGLKDNYIPCEQMQNRVKLPPNARLVILKNSGHLGFIEERDLAAGALRDFIKDISTGQI
jgi:pimeloyl-ACP methyl ester carboxylesterase